MAKKNSITKNYIYNMIYQLIIMFAPLITIPYLSRVLGAEKIGIYSYTLSISTYFILFGSLGTAIYGQREMAFYQDDKNNLSKKFFEIFFFRCFSLFISLISFYLIFCIHDNYSFYKILMLDILASCFDINWFFQGIEEFKKKLIRTLIIKLIYTLSIFIFIKDQNDLGLYIFIYAVSNLVGNLSLWLYLPKYLKKIKIKELDILSHLKPTIQLFIPQIAIQIYTVLDKTMIGIMVLDKSEVGYYEQAQKIIKILITLSTSLGTVMSPRIANIYIKNDFKSMKKYMNVSLSIILMLSFPLMLGIISIVNSFVPIFYGPGFEKVSILIIILSLIILLIGLSNWIGVQYLLPTKQQKKYTISVVAGAIVNFILNLILISSYKSIGASIATVVAEFTVTCLQLYLVRKEINFKDIIKMSYKYFVAAVLSFVICIFINLIIKNNWLNVIIVSTVYIITYFTLLYLLKEENILRMICKLEKMVGEKDV